MGNPYACSLCGGDFGHLANCPASPENLQRQADLEEREDRLYDLALKVTDEVLGSGTYAEINKNNPDPGVQAAIKRSEEYPVDGR